MVYKYTLRQEKNPVGFCRHKYSVKAPNKANPTSKLF